MNTSQSDLSKIFILLVFLLTTLTSYGQAVRTDDCGTTAGAELSVGSSCTLIDWDCSTNGNYWSSGAGGC
ncbi:MAG: hypothetical protein QNK89_05290 [Lacinutrix sp.]|uniref:hypothetical protein n=1 Tax=Lacinutrix sp. TaxID=1937692 RepID=UPI0030A1DD4B